LTSTIKKENIIELKRIVDKTFSNTGDNLMTTIAEKWLNDGIEQGIEKGIEQGIKQGALKEKINLAKKLLLKGLSDKEILELTDLTIQQLQDLKTINSTH
jgi:predicted transposase/invertase (TIGR01784 family)